MKVAFHCNQLGLRGTQVALYDYAHFNETLLGNESIIVSPASSAHNDQAIEKFTSRFPVFFYNDLGELSRITAEIGVDVCYFIKSGKNDGVLTDGCKNVVHVVFHHHEPHGDVYAYVSKWLAEKMRGGKSPFVPHMINLPEIDGDLREELSIPSDAHVFGTYGGEKSFDVGCAVNAVLDAANDPASSAVFIFMNTQMKISNPVQRFRLNRALKNRRIIYLPGSADPERKVKFIQTCDAMLHARKSGETFGIAIGEFAFKHKPIIAHYSRRTKDQCHYDILGDKGNYYTSRKELRKLLAADPGALKTTDRYNLEFNPEAVMSRFQDVFLRA